MEKLKSDKNNLLKKYKGCYYFGSFLNGKRHGVGITKIY